MLSATVLVGVVLYYGILSDAPLPDRRWLHGKNDLFLHAAAFFVLALPVLTLWPRAGTVIGLAGLAALVEVAQIWIPRRNPGLDDILASLAGVALGAGVLWSLAWIFALPAVAQSDPADGPHSNLKPPSAKGSHAYPADR